MQNTVGKEVEAFINVLLQDGKRDCSEIIVNGGIQGCPYKIDLAADIGGLPRLSAFGKHLGRNIGGAALLGILLKRGSLDKHGRHDDWQFMSFDIKHGQAIWEFLLLYIERTRRRWDAPYCAHREQTEG